MSRNGCLNIASIPVAASKSSDFPATKGIIEALCTRQGKIRFIQVKHEEAASLAACGLAADKIAGARLIHVK